MTVFALKPEKKKKGEKVYPSAGTKARIKSMYNLMFDYAVEFEVVTINYARTFDISDEIVKEQEETKRGNSDWFPYTAKFGVWSSRTAIMQYHSTANTFCNDKGQTYSGSYKITYDKYRHRFDKVIQALELNPLHRPHDPRMTFITMAKKSNVDEYAIKVMVGHKVKDITESTYTVRDIEWLRADLEKISEENLN